MKCIWVFALLAALAVAVPVSEKPAEEKPIEENPEEEKPVSGTPVDEEASEEVDTSEEQPGDGSAREGRFIVPIYSSGAAATPAAPRQPPAQQRGLFPFFNTGGTTANAGLFTALLAALRPKPTTAAAATGATPTLFFYNPITGIIPIGQKPAQGRSLPEALCEEDTPECQELMLKELLSTGQKIYEENPHLLSNFFLAPSQSQQRVQKLPGYPTQNAPGYLPRFIQPYPQQGPYYPVPRHSRPQLDLIYPNINALQATHGYPYPTQGYPFPNPAPYSSNLISYPQMTLVDIPSIQSMASTLGSQRTSPFLQALPAQPPHLQNPPTAYRIFPEESDQNEASRPNSRYRGAQLNPTEVSGL